MSRRGGFVTELGIAVLIATVVGVAVLLATGELGAAWDALRDDQEDGVEVSEGADDASPSPSGTSGESGEGELPPPDQIAYIDVNNISDELQEGGLVCNDTNVHLRDEESQTGTCASEGGSEITIFVYLDPSAAPASFDEFIEVTEGRILEGPNWYLASTDSDFVTAAQQILGGEVREL